MLILRLLAAILMLVAWTRSASAAACVTDADCATHYRCADAETCGSEGCSQPIKRECVVATIECQTAAECPTSWSCGKFENCIVLVDLMTKEETYSPPGCNTKMQCHPPDSTDGSGDPAAAPAGAEAKSAAPAASSDEGCSASGRTTGAVMPWLLLALVAGGRGLHASRRRAAHRA